MPLGLLVVVPSIEQVSSKPYSPRRTEHRDGFEKLLTKCCAVVDSCSRDALRSLPFHLSIGRVTPVTVPATVDTREAM